LQVSSTPNTQALLRSSRHAKQAFRGDGMTAAVKETAPSMQSKQAASPPPLHARLQLLRSSGRFAALPWWLQMTAGAACR
jgi:hypothetical protein